MTEYYSTVYMYDIIFIHSCQWTLGCFHVLAIANSAAVITGVHVSFWTMFSLDIWPEKTFSFLGTSIQFSTVAAPIYIPTNSVGGFPSLGRELSSFYILGNWRSEKGSNFEKINDNRTAGLGLEPGSLKSLMSVLATIPWEVQRFMLLTSREGSVVARIGGPFRKTALSKRILSPFGGRCSFYQIVRPECSCLETGKGSEEESWQRCQLRTSRGNAGIHWAYSTPCPQVQTQALVPTALFLAQWAASAGGAALFHSTQFLVSEAFQRFLERSSSTCPERWALMEL